MTDTEDAGRKRRTPRSWFASARTMIGGGGGRRAALVMVILAGAVPYLAWELFPGDVPPPAKPTKPDPRYASQSGDALKAREANVQQKSDEVVDAALETCAGIGVGHLAAKYGLPEDELLVARRFSSSYERSYRDRVYEGCLSGLRHGG